jgi:hypothetical protein
MMFNIKPKAVEPKLPLNAQRMVNEMKDLNWQDVSKYNIYTLEGDTYHQVQKIRDDILDKKIEEEAEAEKQAGMNPVRRAVYKAVQKPVGDWWNKHFKKEPKSLEMPKQHLPFIWYD